VCMARDKETKKRVRNGDGLIEKIENEEWQRHVNWADLILTSDNVKWLKELDAYRKKGYPVFAPSWESAQLELERGKGQDLFRKVGIKVVDYEVFRDYRKAEEHVRSQMKRVVSKPMGDRDKALSYVSKSPADMCYMLQRWAKLEPICKPFLIQEFVGGIEFAVNGWLGPKGFARHIEEAFEHKKLMNDDYGPNTGEMGTAIKYVSKSSLADEVLFPLERELIKMGHRGSVDVSVIIDEDGNPMPLEFTCRPGWPAFNIVQPLHPDPCEWMAHLIDGEDTFAPKLDHAIGVVLAIPDFPYNQFESKKVSGIPIYNLDDDNPYREYLAPCEVESGVAPAMDGDEIVQKRLMVSTGQYLAVATGCGDSVREAQEEAYKAAESMEIPNNVILRTDIGDKMKKQIPQLQEYGYATDWVY
jgi:phosphoribosylamine--glycine ligase